MNLLILPEDGDLTKAYFRSFIPSKDEGAENIWKIYQDKKDRLWVGSKGAGLFLMELPKDPSLLPISKNWNPKFHQYKHEEKNSIITSNHIEDIYQDLEDNLWVSTPQGLNCIWAKDLKNIFKNKKANEKVDFFFDQYHSLPNNPTSLVNNNVNVIFQDQQGILWFGTYSGVSVYNQFTNQFEIYNFVDDIFKASYTQNIYIDKKGIVWFGYGENGIIQYDLSKNKKTLFDLKDRMLTGNYVFNLYSPDDRHLYIGTKKGVIVLDMETNKSKYFPPPDYIVSKNGFVDIRSIFCDNQNRIWLGTLTGLHVINQETGAYQRSKHQPYNTQSISDNSINQIYQDSNDDIWVATFNGLNKVIDITANEVKFKQFKHDSKNPKNCIPSNRVLALIEINRTLYIGSNTGLSAYDLKHDKFIHFNKVANKKHIQTLEKTVDGNIWASTPEGILFFNTHSKEFNHYDKKDGLEDIVFQSGASNRDQNGYIYFGNRQGITRFHPVNLTSNELPPEVHITEVRKMSPDQATSMNSLYAKEIVLEHNEYYLSIDYAALNYNRPEKNKYAFKLEGLDDQWNYPEGKIRAVYTNLEAGNYTFRVKAANNEGVWNEEGASLKITKRAYFMQTWWFKFLVTLGIILGIFLGLKSYTSRINERNKILQQFNKDLKKEITHRKKVEVALQEREQHMEHLVTVRTQELEVKNKEVETLLYQISERNERLEIKIANRTKNLKLSNEELKRSNKDLEQFAYIASHDLQEPLRVVGGFISLLRRRYKQHFDEEAFQYIDFAIDGVQRMSMQIKNVLTFSKVSQQEIDYKLTNLNNIIETKLHDLSKNIEEKIATRNGILQSYK